MVYRLWVLRKGYLTYIRTMWSIRISKRCENLSLAILSLADPHVKDNVLVSDTGAPLLTDFGINYSYIYSASDAGTRFMSVIYNEALQTLRKGIHWMTFRRQQLQSFTHFFYPFNLMAVRHAAVRLPQ